jgi:hypothetical protein
MKGIIAKVEAAITIFDNVYMLKELKILKLDLIIEGILLL